jgi:hypothetical protein
MTIVGRFDDGSEGEQVPSLSSTKHGAMPCVGDRDLSGRNIGTPEARRLSSSGPRSILALSIRPGADTGLYKSSSSVRSVTEPVNVGRP